MTKAEYIKRYGIERYEEYKKQCMYRYNNDSEFRKYKITRTGQHNKDKYKNNVEYHNHINEYCKEFQRNDLNINDKTKMSIRQQSRWILFNKRKHTKLKGYEIHHCFGYEDPAKFIYIPKSLHTKIHQYLRDNNIDADSNHYKFISTMINECEEYTYISV